MTAPSTTQENFLYIQPGFEPLAQQAYLFDIDGTLLRSKDRVHYRSFTQAVEAVLGHPLSLEGVKVHGNTDPGILRDAFLLTQVREATWRAQSEAILAHMGQNVVAQREAMSVDIMPGVEGTLDYLRAQGAALGVATGNIEAIGWLKIELAHLRHYFTFGGFSDGYEDRAEMIANAAGLARAAAKDPQATVCVVGDTPSDIAAARANHLPTIAVATGTYSYEELLAHKPEACAPTLEALLAHCVAASQRS